MSKGSQQRPTDMQRYAENYDRIFRKPEGMMTTPNCGWPFCECREKCEKKEVTND